MTQKSQYPDHTPKKGFRLLCRLPVRGIDGGDEFWDVYLHPGLEIYYLVAGVFAEENRTAKFCDNIRKDLWAYLRPRLDEALYDPSVSPNARAKVRAS